MNSEHLTEGFRYVTPGIESGPGFIKIKKRVWGGGALWKLSATYTSGHIIEPSNLTAVPRRNVLRAEVHLLSNYSSGAGEVAYLLVEAHRACSASRDEWQ